MGAQWDDGYAIGATFTKAMHQLITDKQWEHGHGGYSGTLAEKSEDAVFCGTLPPRVTSTQFDLIAERWAAYKEDGKWEDRVKIPLGEDEPSWKQNWRTVNRRKDPRPNALKNQAGASMLEKWWLYRDGNKWGPAAAIRLNDRETREYKRSRGRLGTRDKVWYVAGYCSS